MATRTKSKRTLEQVTALIRKHRKAGRTAVVHIYEGGQVVKTYQVKPAAKRGRKPKAQEPARVARKTKGRPWTKQEVRRVLTVVRKKGSNEKLKTLAQQLKRSFGSVSAMRSNINSLLTGKGFGHSGNAVKEVVRAYKASRRK